MVSIDSNEKTGTSEVLKSSMVGNVYYAAIKETRFATDTKPETSKIFAVVCLTSVDNKDYFNFSYKDMDESCGPYEHKCPIGILKLLPETNDEWALEWREKCLEYHKRKANKLNLAGLKVGSKISYFRYNPEVPGNTEEVILVKHAPSYQFTRSFWMNEEAHVYVPSRRIPDDYKVLFQA